MREEKRGEEKIIEREREREREREQEGERYIELRGNSTCGLEQIDGCPMYSTFLKYKS
jgi:hypothetical protein